MNEDEKIIQICQASDRFTALTDKGRIYTLENYPYKHWKLLVVSDTPPASGASGPDKKRTAN